jgi:hypothetical protein
VNKEWLNNQEGKGSGRMNLAEKVKVSYTRSLLNLVTKIKSKLDRMFLRISFYAVFTANSRLTKAVKMKFAAAVSVHSACDGAL